MNSLLRNLLAALQSLRESPNRTALSATGIAVGATAIILLVSIALGVKQDVGDQVRDLGVNVLVVIPGRIDDGTFNPNLGGASYLKDEDAQAIQRVAGVVQAEPFTFLGGGVHTETKSANSLLAAATAGWFKMRPVSLQEGRPIQDGDENRDVVLLGSIAKEQLFGKTSALGKWVSLNQHRYQVIGVTEDKKQEQSLFSFGSLQNLVYVPYGRARQLNKDLQTDRIMIQTLPNAEPKQLIKALDAVLARRLDRQQFQVLTQEDLLGLVYKLMSILTWLLTGLTSIALFVGGVGIMTVMLMSVNERAKEIGIRKTTGARQNDIFVQFLFEALLIAAVGVVSGLAFSSVIVVLMKTYTPVKPMITPYVILLTVGACVSVGGIFGVIPAIKAARRDPVAALRME